MEMENPTSLSYNDVLELSSHRHKSNNISSGVDLEEPLPRNPKSRMRVFEVVSETIQFTVTARSISSAFNRAAGRVGQGRQICVHGADRTLSGMVPVES
jgi:hypothetical protein